MSNCFKTVFCIMLNWMNADRHSYKNMLFRGTVEIDSSRTVFLKITQKYVNMLV